MAQLILVLDDNDMAFYRCRGYGGAHQESWDRHLRPLIDEARVLCRRAGRSVIIQTPEGTRLWSSDEDS